MKSLWLINLGMFLLLMSAACSSGNSAKREMAKDTVKTVLPDTVKPVPADTVPVAAPAPVSTAGGKQHPATMAKGDSVQPTSSQVRSTEKGTTSRNTGAVKNPGANQAVTDSIKKAKSKGKGK